jgi:hypothetical protein
MQRINRILAIIVMVISVLVLIVSLAGIIGVWIVRTQITASLEEVVANAETRVIRVEQGLDQINAELADASDQVTEMENNLQSLGDDIEQNKPLVTAVTDGLESKLSPFIDTANRIATTIIGGAAALNSTVETLNALPFISIPNPEFENIDRLSQEFEDLQSQVQEVRITIDQRQSEIIQGAVSIVTEPLSRINSRLDTLQSRVSGYSEGYAAIQAGLEEFQASIGRWLTYAALLVILMMLWLALSQAGLFVLGWRFYSGKDLLAGVSQAAPPSMDSIDEVEETDIL